MPATKTINKKKYELEGFYKSLTEAKARAENLEGRLHIFTRAITRTKVSKIPRKQGQTPLYAVWIRKEGGKK